MREQEEAFDIVNARVKERTLGRLWNIMPERWQR